MVTSQAEAALAKAKVGQPPEILLNLLILP